MDNQKLKNLRFRLITMNLEDVDKDEWNEIKHRIEKMYELSKENYITRQQVDSVREEYPVR
ncbi:hypothetical protein NW133_07145 [Staphylococcus pettenkoferi]|uniref:Uncharacterized protein n=1 Tax=Staphylococcus pettenkoferi TaxID=170573 RepID=A0ABT4BNG2_9STAP|nr:hypothetical protein [Staphylococcus pettenkoferi]MCY1563868.1 hypothetical protein [Staphylococcus pettenkoferi]MCY1583302.1 hypothetical protein [Staphylococcus pettenkoferi]